MASRSAPAVLLALALLAMMGAAMACDKSYSYYLDEGTNPGGPNRCSNSCQCDGVRTCSSAGFCQGQSRPAGFCTSPDYFQNEATNPLGSNRCPSGKSDADCLCDGRRTCSSSGFCQGSSRP